jgi:hypothetical protein
MRVRTGFMLDKDIGQEWALLNFIMYPRFL